MFCFNLVNRGSQYDSTGITKDPVMVHRDLTGKRAAIDLPRFSFWSTEAGVNGRVI